MPNRRSEPKQLHVNLFEMNCVSHIIHGLWVHPENNRHRFNDLDYWLDTVGRDGLVRRESLTLRLRWFHRFELERLLETNGFELVQLFGDFDGSEYGDGSPHIIALARRV